MSANPSDSHILAWARLMKASQLVLGAVEAELKAAGFPPLAWYDVLLELKREERGRLRPVEIEGRLLIAQHNVSRLIDRLEKAGYVARQRCQDDGRGQVISITDEGRALLSTIQGVVPDYAIAPDTVSEDFLAGVADAEAIQAVYATVDERRSSIVEKQTHLEKVVERLPKFRQGLLHLAITHLQLGREKEALPLLERYIALHPKDAVVHYYLAAIHLDRKSVV